MYDTHNDRQLITAEQLHQTRDQAGLDHHLNTLISTIS